MSNEKTTEEFRASGIQGLSLMLRHRLRTRLMRRLLITIAMITVIIGMQTYLFYSKLIPQFKIANEQYIHLIDERRDWALAEKIAESINDLRLLSDSDNWESEIEQVQNEFNAFLTTPSEGLEVTLNHLAKLNDQITTEDQIFQSIKKDLIRIGEWHHDYYGDIASTITRPGILLWPTSIILIWIHGGSLLDTVQFNRALYHINVGEVSAGQATLGELRTRLPDTPLRARVLFTQGRLLYGMGRFEESVEVMQESVTLDPSQTLAKRFLEYQLSHGPDEEVEDEHEGVEPLGGISAGGGTLF